MKNYKHRNDCRLCGAEFMDLVLPILPSPIGDAFVPKEKLSELQETYPLDTYMCLECGHVQNLDVVNPDFLFRDYTYRTSASLGLVEHFKKYAFDVIEILSIPLDSLVIEMGSNDGSLLKAFKNNGMRVLGIDPAVSIATKATNEGITTKAEYFSSDLARKIINEVGCAQLFCANNVFAHIDDIRDIVRGVRAVLSKNGVFVFEVSYLPDMVDKFVFDTIYHEHVSHHTLIPLERFFNHLDMTLFHVKRISTKGGSIRAFAQTLSTGDRNKTIELKTMIELEQARGFHAPEIYRKFYLDIEIRKKYTLEYLIKAVRNGKTISAYGASTTTTTLLYHFELQNLVSSIYDDNPIKHYLFSPGAHIPVLPSEKIIEMKPDIIVILAWQYANIIIEKHKNYLQSGGCFLIPLPELRIINH
jgi:SAM-dependent methyltransferase